jgi:adenosylhomocysteine nucleosidase
VRVLLTFAVEPEFAPFRRLREFETSHIGEQALYSSQIGRAAVDVILTGMGPANATRAVNAALATSAPYTICICSGFCGSLKAEYSVGDILAAQSVSPVSGKKTIECSSGLATQAWADGAKLAKKLFSSDEIVASAEEKARLAPFADAVDMESFSVLDLTTRRKLSSVAIRVVSDRFDQDMPVDFSTTVDDKGQVRIGGVLKQVVKHPIYIPALIRLGRESKTAAQGLANFLEAYIKKVSFLSHGEMGKEEMDIAARPRAN